MTREELIDFIKSSKGHWTFTTESGKEISKEQVIKALEQEPICEDCISRERMLKYFEGWKNQIKYYHPYAKNFDIPYEEAIQWVKDMPSVNPQKPKSEWQHDHEILNAYSDGASEVIDKIKRDVFNACSDNYHMPVYKLGCDEIFEIINKYTAEGSEAE